MINKDLTQFFLITLTTSCMGAPLPEIITQLNTGWNIREVTILFNYTPEIPGWSDMGGATGLRVFRTIDSKIGMIDVSRKDIWESLGSPTYPKSATVFLALSTARIKAFVSQILAPNKDLQATTPSYELIVPVIHLDEAEAILADVYVPIQCQVYFLVVPPSWNFSEPLAMFEAYHGPMYRPENLPLSLTIGKVPCDGNLPTMQETMWNRRRNLQGVVLLAGTAENAPWVIVKKRGKRGHAVEVTGFMPELWGELEKNLNFSTVYRIDVDQDFGSEAVDGHWTGLMGMLQRRDVDVAVAGMSVTNSRMKTVDFTQVVYHERFRVYYKNGRTIFAATLTTATSWDILLILIVTVVVTTVAQLIVLRCAEELDGKQSRFTSPSVVFFYNLYAFCQQGIVSDRICKWFSSQLVLWITYFGGMIIFNIYSATLISRITVLRTSFPYYNLAELIASNQFQLMSDGAAASLSPLTLCSTNASCVVNNIGNSFKRVKSQHEGINMVCEGENYALYTSGKSRFQKHGDHYHFKNLLHCSLDFIPTRDEDGLSIAMTKGFPYHGLINFSLRKLEEGGVLKRMQEKWYPKVQDQDSIPESIDIKQAIPLFLWVQFGLMASLAVLLAELCFFKCCTIWRKKKSLRNVACKKIVLREYMN